MHRGGHEALAGGVGTDQPAAPECRSRPRELLALTRSVRKGRSTTDTDLPYLRPGCAAPPGRVSGTASASMRRSAREFSGFRRTHAESALAKLSSGAREGPAELVCHTPLHPYTQMLLDAVPVPDVETQRQRRAARAGAPAVAVSGAGGAGSACPFAARCAHATIECRTVRPVREVLASGAVVACHHWREIADRQTPARVEAQTPKIQVSEP